MDDLSQEKMCPGEVCWVSVAFSIGRDRKENENKLLTLMEDQIFMTRIITPMCCSLIQICHPKDWAKTVFFLINTLFLTLEKHNLQLQTNILT